MLVRSLEASAWRLRALSGVYIYYESKKKGRQKILDSAIMQSYISFHSPCGGSRLAFVTDEWVDDEQDSTQARAEHSTTSSQTARPAMTGRPFSDS